jgi:Protein of unknown function (DUF3102)
MTKVKRPVGARMGLNLRAKKKRTFGVQKEPLPQTDDYAAKINTCWRQSVESIIEAGRILLQAKEDLPHGEFGRMINELLTFGPRTAQKLMEIARHPVISNATHVTHLPASWSTLYALTELPEEAIEELITTHRIHPDLERSDVAEIQKELGERGVYSSEAAIKAIALLTRWMSHWPVSGAVGQLYYEGGLSDDNIAALPELASWLSGLHDEIIEELRMVDEREMEAENAGASS